MNKKGFTLFEILAVIVVLVVIFLLSIPIVKGVIEYSRYKTFKTSALNVIDAVDLSIAKNNFKNIPEEGIDIEDIDISILKNNNFDSGNIVRHTEQTEITYLKQGIYCAKGTKSEFFTSDKGCGALDTTAPTKANLFLKNETTDYLYIVAGGYDHDSNIIKYELSIDGGKYFTNSDDSYNVFKIKKDGKKHSYKTRVSNEAHLTLESESKQFEQELETIICIEENNLENAKSKKNIICSLETETPEISETFEMNNNKKIKIDNIITTLDIKNIDNIIKDSTPVLDDNMIPVIYNGTNWVVANKNIKYWNYENKEWANAVIVRKKQNIDDPMSKSRNYYLSNEAIGEPVYENDILGHFVWIPNYSYSVWNKSGIDIKTENKGVRNIEITFDKSNTEYTNHGAFLYEENIPGFWVSKYEAGISNNSTCSLVPNSQNCNLNNFDLYFNGTSSVLKNISISNAYQNIQKLNNKYNLYGATGNIHLLTNLEWGAITYLSHSKYGIGSNIVNETTTGNVTGIYNMGINKEFVFGNYNNDLGFDSNDNSGFTEIPETYKDTYKSSTIKGALIGDATLETENWYDSEHQFINGSYPFIIRGNNSIFAFNNSSGSASDTTFRVAIIKNDNN